MPARGEDAEGRLSIEGSFLLLVEGLDEKYVLGKMVETRIKDQGVRGEIQIIPAGGRRVFRRRLEAINLQSKKMGMVKAIGIVRDADESAGSAFQSVANDVRAVGLRPPRGHSEYSRGNPAVGIFIVPDGSSSGAMETLIRRTVGGDSAALCVNAYLDCLIDAGAMSSRNMDKSFVHAYLASMPDPLVRVGEAAMQGVWDFTSAVFDPMNQFLEELVSERG